MLFDSFEGYDIQKVRKKSREEGRKAGRKAGKKQGAEAKARYAARNMYARGFGAEETAGLLGESLETVKEWYQSWSEESDS